MGFSLTSGAGIDDNAPYQAQELQITTLANPSKQANLLFNLDAKAHFSCLEHCSCKIDLLLAWNLII